MDALTHFDPHGQATMVDIGQKTPTHRQAIASGVITVSKSTLDLVNQQAIKKGDVLAIARLASIQATKQTAFLIPLCHPLSLTKVAVDFEICDKEEKIKIIVCVETFGQTGVEMEALQGVSTGLLTIYDMLKAVDKSMVIGQIRLDQKQGGKSGVWQHPQLNNTTEASEAKEG